MRHTRTTFMENFNLIWCKMCARRACKVLHVQKCENSFEFQSAITLRPFECHFWNLACIFINTRTNSLLNFVGIESKMFVKCLREVCTCVTKAIFTKLEIFIVVSLRYNCILYSITIFKKFDEENIKIKSLLSRWSREPGQWRNVEGLVKKSPLGGRKSPLRGAPRSRVYLEQFVKKWLKNLNK